MARNQSPALVDGAMLDAARPHIIRWGNVLLLVLSFLCTIIAFNRNNWLLIADPIALFNGASAAGVGLQVWCTGCQWLNRKDKSSFWYIQAYVADVAPTSAGLHPIFFLTLNGLISGVIGLPNPVFAKDVMVLGDVSLLWLVAAPLALWAAHNIAYRPEQNLIEN